MARLAGRCKKRGRRPAHRRGRRRADAGGGVASEVVRMRIRIRIR
jgi:hypothetical protein